MRAVLLAGRNDARDEGATDFFTYGREGTSMASQPHEYEGSAIHCVARSSIAHCVTPKLEVGEVFSINRFTDAPARATYRFRRDDPHVIQLEGNTTVHKLDCDRSGFLRQPFEICAIEDIAFNGNKSLIDVVGRVINMGVSKPTRNGSKFVEFHILNERGQTSLWGSLSDKILNLYSGPESVYVVLLIAMNIKEYNGNLQLSSTSDTIIFDGDDVLEIAEIRESLRNGVQPSNANEGTLIQMLQLGREAKLQDLPTTTLYCTIKITGVRPKNSWYYYSCVYGTFKKGLAPIEGQLRCESCDRLCEFPVLRYRLHLDVEDDTTTMAVTVFDEIVEKMLRKPASILMEELGNKLMLQISLMKSLCLLERSMFLS